MVLKRSGAFFPFCAETFLILLQPREVGQRVIAPRRKSQRTELLVDVTVRSVELEFLTA